MVHPTSLSHRLVWRLAGPIILANLAVPLLGAVDTAVMGHLSDPAFIGAVAVGALIFNFLYWGFGFLRMGTTGFAAQAAGAGEGDELRAVLWRAVLTGAFLGLALIALQWPIRLVAFPLINASEAVAGHAGIYFAIRIWGAPAMLITYAILGWLLGVQNARAVLWLQLFLNGLNIALNLFLVLGLGMTIDGVALGTVIAEYAALVVGLLLVARELRRRAPDGRAKRLLDRDRLLALIRVNRDIFIRTLCLITAFAVFTSLGARMGDLTLAGNAILISLLHFTAYGLDGFAHAAEVLAGGAVGARRRARFRDAVRATSLWALLLSVAVAILLAAAGPAIIALYTDIPQVRAAALTYLPWMIAMPVVAVWSYQLDGVFIGATRTRAMRDAMLVSIAVYLVALWVFVPTWGNHGLWAALLLFMAVRGLTLAVAYPALERSVEPTAGG